MSPTAKSIVSAIGILGAAGSILVGATLRDRVDVGGASTQSSIPTDGLVASRDTREVPEGDYFYEITNLLKQRYVEPIKDERKLAVGAVRGMVASLGDPDSLYMDRELFAVHQAMREGRFEGIGAQLELVYRQPKDAAARASGQPPDPEDALVGNLRIPRLTVVSVVPGGPADRAGVQNGDYVEYIDGHWIPNSETVSSFRKLQRDFNDGKVKWEQLSSIQQELSKRTKKSIMPGKAREKLLVGKEGVLNIVWKRGEASRTTRIVKAESRMPAFSTIDGAIHIRFIPGVANELRKTIAEQQPVVLDLRNNANGLYGPMVECLELLAPKGSYGTLKLAKRTAPLTVKTGNALPPKVVILVDSSTRGAAEIFARALAKAGVATLSGGKTGGHPVLTEDNPLPDGSGYSLAIAEYTEAAK